MRDFFLKWSDPLRFKDFAFQVRGKCCTSIEDCQFLQVQAAAADCKRECKADCVVEFIVGELEGISEEFAVDKLKERAVKKLEKRAVSVAEGLLAGTLAVGKKLFFPIQIYDAALTIVCIGECN